MIIYDRWSHYAERLPIIYAKVTHLVAIDVLDGGVTKGALVIMD
jgi:hypothetical protein